MLHGFPSGARLTLGRWIRVVRSIDSLDVRCSMNVLMLIGASMDPMEVRCNYDRRGRWIPGSRLAVDTGSMDA